MSNYTVNDLIAAIFAQASIADLGFRGDQLREAVRLVQSGDRQRLERAEIVTVRTKPGFMRHLLISDMEAGAEEFVELLGLKGEFTDCEAMVDFLAAQEIDGKGRVVDRAPIWDAYQAIRDQVARKYLQNQMLSAENEAGWTC